MTEPTTVCGRAKYHDGLHGAWVRNGTAEAWQCRVLAEPRIKKNADHLWVCLECFGQFNDHTQAAQHWWHSHVRIRVLKEIVHGTERAYHTHLRRQETACRACKDAHAAHARARSQGWKKL